MKRTTTPSGPDLDPQRFDFAETAVRVRHMQGVGARLVSVASDDWRLTTQERFLRGVGLRWRPWFPSRRPDLRGGWDHDHCVFCHAEIARHADFTAGYVTADDQYTWICPPCFDDFHEQFRWQVVPAPTDP